MTGSALSAASRYSLSTAAPALARFHSETGLTRDAARNNSSDLRRELPFVFKGSGATEASVRPAFGQYNGGTE